MRHTLRFCPISSAILYYFMSSRMLSSHLFLTIPSSLSLHLQVYIFLVVSPPPSVTRGRTISFLKKVFIGSIFASLQVSSCLMLPFLTFPLAHLSILISVVCSVCVSFFCLSLPLFPLSGVICCPHLCHRLIC